MSIALVIRPEFSTARVIPKLLTRSTDRIFILTDECRHACAAGEVTEMTRALQGIAEVESVVQSPIRDGNYEINVVLKGESNARKVDVVQVARLFADDDMSASDDLLAQALDFEGTKGVGAVVNGSEYCTKATADVVAAINKRRHDIAQERQVMLSARVSRAKRHLLQCRQQLEELAAGDDAGATEHAAAVVKQALQALTEAKGDLGRAEDYVRLPGNGDGVLAFRSKDALSKLAHSVRRRLARDGVAQDLGLHEVPCHSLTSSDSVKLAQLPREIVSDLARRKPYVFKPDNKAGSLGVCIVRSYDDLVAAYNKFATPEDAADEEAMQEGGFQAKHFLLQPYIEADNVAGLDELGVPFYHKDQGEFSVEGYVNDGSVNVLTFTRTLIDKKHMLEEGHIAQADIDPELAERLTRSINEMVKQAKLFSGVFHIEFRVNTRHVVVGGVEKKRYCIYPIDAALRPPGCTLDDMVKRQTEQDMYELMVDLAYRRQVAPAVTRKTMLQSRAVGLYFPRIAESATGYDRLVVEDGCGRRYDALPYVKTSLTVMTKPGHGLNANTFQARVASQMIVAEKLPGEEAKAIEPRALLNRRVAYGIEQSRRWVKPVVMPVSGDVAAATETKSPEPELDLGADLRSAKPGLSLGYGSGRSSAGSTSMESSDDEYEVLDSPMPLAGSFRVIDVTRARAPALPKTTSAPSKIGSGARSQLFLPVQRLRAGVGRAAASSLKASVSTAVTQAEASKAADDVSQSSLLLQPFLLAERQVVALAAFFMQMLCAVRGMAGISAGGRDHESCSGCPTVPPKLG